MDNVGTIYHLAHLEENPDVQAVAEVLDAHVNDDSKDVDEVRLLYSNTLSECRQFLTILQS
jgi:F0F1-type ATP synthase gamma subunit